MKSNQKVKKIVSANSATDRIKKRILKKYPKAKSVITTEGLYRIYNGVDGYIGEENFIPPQKTLERAWFWANESIKTTQNTNRTHPDKMIMDFDEVKFGRVSNRNKRIKKHNN